jgi:hypothetical protein
MPERLSARGSPYCCLVISNVSRHSQEITVLQDASSGFFTFN